MYMHININARYFVTVGSVSRALKIALIYAF